MLRERGSGTVQPHTGGLLAHPVRQVARRETWRASSAMWDQVSFSSLFDTGLLVSACTGVSACMGSSACMGQRLMGFRALCESPTQALASALCPSPPAVPLFPPCRSLRTMAQISEAEK